jgi:hypothetical protein
VFQFNFDNNAMSELYTIPSTRDAILMNYSMTSKYINLVFTSSCENNHTVLFIRIDRTTKKICYEEVINTSRSFVLSKIYDDNNFIIFSMIYGYCEQFTFNNNHFELVTAGALHDYCREKFNFNVGQILGTTLSYYNNNNKEIIVKNNIPPYPNKYQYLNDGEFTLDRYDYPIYDVSISINTDTALKVFCFPTGYNFMFVNNNGHTFSILSKQCLNTTDEQEKLFDNVIGRIY